MKTGKNRIWSADCLMCHARFANWFRFGERGICACARRQRQSSEIQACEVPRICFDFRSRWRRRTALSGKTGPQRIAANSIMRPQDRYLMFVRWNEEDHAYVGYCPDLFPAGGVCHGATPVEAFGKLCEAVEDMVVAAEEQGLPLPLPQTRPMREVEAIA